MNEPNNISSLNEDNEISLIDLISVIIRYRMMIVIGSATVFILTALYLFVLPVLFPNVMMRESTVEYSIEVTSIPSMIASELPSKYFNLKTVLNAEFTDPIFLAKELSKNNPYIIKNGKKITETEFNGFVQTLQKNKKITVSQAPVRDEVIIKMKIPEGNLDIATKFVDSMISSVNSYIEDPFLREIMKIKNTKQETYDEIKATFSENSNITDAQVLMLSVRQINEFINSYKCISERTLEPFVILEPIGRIKKLIVITFIALFVFVLIAFLIIAIENIKKDSEASGKIKTAWDEGKFGRK